MMTNLNCRLGFLQSKMKKAAVIFMSHRPMRPATFFTRWLSRFEILCPMLVPEKLREKEMVGKKNIKDKAKGPYHGKRSRNPPLIRKGASRLTSGCTVYDFYTYRN